MARTSPPFQLHLFGVFQLERGARAIHLPTRKVESLFAYLVLHPESHAREKLAALLWGESADEQARSSLRTALAALRKELGDDVLIAGRETVQLNPDFPLWVDAQEFQRIAKSELGIANAAEQFAIRDSPFSIELLPDFYDDWITPERERLRVLYLDTLLRLVQQARSESKYARAIELAQKVLAHDPANEKAHQHLMFCYATSGNRAFALEQYDKCKRALQDEFGVEPSSETTTLYEKIRAEEIGSQSQEALLGNLPIALTSFVGRADEMQQVKQAIATTRLLTLTGAGGCGKTRLVIQVATELSATNRFRDGVWWVDLAGLSDPALVTQSVAIVFNLSETPGTLLIAVLTDYLRAKELLLVVDNCEHLLGACARLLSALISTCPKLHIMATSREALNISGELAWRVPSLALPDIEHLPPLEKLRQFDAIQLFTERALAVTANWRLVENAAPAAQVCARLDGIPLAIELAAARLKVLSVPDIAARLDDRFNLLTSGSRNGLPRHQTLRATMDWSYDLLSDAERALLRRLSVFAGGWTLEAAEVVCGGQWSVDSNLLTNHRPLSTILDLLTSLIDKSLVVVETRGNTTRYRLLETVRQYAREKLVDASEEEQTLERHLNYFVNLAEEAYPEILTAKEKYWADRLENEMDNLRAGLAWGIERNLDGAARLASSLHFFWDAYGHLKEGRDWLERIIPKIEGWGNDIRRARVLNAAGNIIRAQIEHHTARPLLELSLVISETIGAKPEMAFALLMLGNVQYLLNDAQAARSCLVRALSLYRELDSENFTARAIRYMGMVAMLECDWQAAEKLYDESLALARRAGDRMCVAGGLRSKANLANKQGDYRRAKPLYEESVAMCEELPSGTLRMQSLWNLAFYAMSDGDYPRAKSLLQKCVTLDREQGSMTNLVRDVRHLGGLCTAVGKPVPGARLLGAAVALHEVFRGPMQAMDQRSYNQFVEDTVAAIGKEAFEEAWQEGRKMTLDEAIDYALENVKNV